MPDALSKLQAGMDKARGKLAAQRLGGREWDVTVSIWTPGDDLVGTAGTWGGAITLSPRPKVVVKAVFRMTENGPLLVGDATVSGISRVNYTEAQLKPANSVPSRWTINGKNYSLVEPQPKPTEWIAILKEEMQ